MTFRERAQQLWALITGKRSRAPHSRDIVILEEPEEGPHDPPVPR